MSTRYWLGSLFCGLLMLSAAPVAGQDLGVHVPIGGTTGVTGVIGLPENIDKFYSDVNRIIVGTGNGIDRLSRRKGTRIDNDSESLERLRPGTAVAVHYMVKGIQTSSDEVNGIEREGSKLNEGIVTRIDPPRKRITVRFSDGAKTTLRLTRSPAHGGRVVVYFPDESGRRVAHYFKPEES